MCKVMLTLALGLSVTSFYGMEFGMNSGNIQLGSQEKTPVVSCVPFGFWDYGLQYLAGAAGSVVGLYGGMAIAYGELYIGSILFDDSIFHISPGTAVAVVGTVFLGATFGYSLGVWLAGFRSDCDSSLLFTCGAAILGAGLTAGLFVISVPLGTVSLFVLMPALTMGAFQASRHSTLPPALVTLDGKTVEPGLPIVRVEPDGKGLLFRAELVSASF